MCKYEMDPASTVGDTERARFRLLKEGRTDGRTVKWNQYTPPNFVGGGYEYTCKYW